MKNCFIKANLSIKQLEINLHKLVDQYGIDELNNYAKSAWYFYEKFDISKILAETSKEIARRITIEQKLSYVPEISKLDIETAKWDSSDFLGWVTEHFFTEIDTCFKLYDVVMQTLKTIFAQDVISWDIKLFDLVISLFTFKDLYSRIGHDVMEEVHMGGAFLAVKQGATEEETNRTHEGGGDIMWRIATRGYLFETKNLMQIELSQENRWQLLNYELIYSLQEVFLNITREISITDSIIQLAIKIIKNYIIDLDISSLYKLILLPIKLSKQDMTENIKALVDLIDKAKYFTLTPLELNKIEFIDTLGV